MTRSNVDSEDTKGTVSKWRQFLSMNGLRSLGLNSHLSFSPSASLAKVPTLGVQVFSFKKLREDRSRRASGATDKSNGESPLTPGAPSPTEGVSDRSVNVDAGHHQAPGPLVRFDRSAPQARDLCRVEFPNTFEKETTATSPSQDTEKPIRSPKEPRVSFTNPWTSSSSSSSSSCDATPPVSPLSKPHLSA